MAMLVMGRFATMESGPDVEKLSFTSEFAITIGSVGMHVGYQLGSAKVRAFCCMTLRNSLQHDNVGRAWDSKAANMFCGRSGTGYPQPVRDSRSGTQLSTKNLLQAWRQTTGGYGVPYALLPQPYDTQFSMHIVTAF
jgi:hypothetical protein